MEVALFPTAGGEVAIAVLVSVAVMVLVSVGVELPVSVAVALPVSVAVAVLLAGGMTMSVGDIVAVSVGMTVSVGGTVAVSVGMTVSVGDTMAVSEGSALVSVGIVVVSVGNTVIGSVAVTVGKESPIVLGEFVGSILEIRDRRPDVTSARFVVVVAAPPESEVVMTESAELTSEAIDDATEAADDSAEEIDAMSELAAVEATDCNELATDKIDVAASLADESADDAPSVTTGNNAVVVSAPVVVSALVAVAGSLKIELKPSVIPPSLSVGPVLAASVMVLGRSVVVGVRSNMSLVDASVADMMADSVEVGMKKGPVSSVGGVVVWSVTNASVLAGIAVVVSPEMADATPDKTSPKVERMFPTPESPLLRLVVSATVVFANDVTCLLTALGK